MPSRAEVVDREQVLHGHLHHLPEVDAVVADVDHLVAPGGQVLADVVGPDRQLAVAPVDHDRQLHRPGPAVVVERVERGPDRAAGEEHVVDEHHDRAVEVDGDVGDRLGQHRPQPDVVAVEGDVEACRPASSTPVDLRRARRPARSASGTPPVCRPTSTTSSSPWLRSMISWAMRQIGPLHVVGVHHPGPGNENAPVRGRRCVVLVRPRGILPVRAGLTGPASRSDEDGSSRDRRAQRSCVGDRAGRRRRGRRRRRPRSTAAWPGGCGPRARRRASERPVDDAADRRGDARRAAVRGRDPPAELGARSPGRRSTAASPTSPSDRAVVALDDTRSRRAPRRAGARSQPAIQRSASAEVRRRPGTAVQRCDLGVGPRLDQRRRVGAPPRPQHDRGREVASGGSGDRSGAGPEPGITPPGGPRRRCGDSMPLTNLPESSVE